MAKQRFQASFRLSVFIFAVLTNKNALEFCFFHTAGAAFSPANVTHTLTAAVSVAEPLLTKLTAGDFEESIGLMTGTGWAGVNAHGVWISFR